MTDTTPKSPNSSSLTKWLSIVVLLIVVVIGIWYLTDYGTNLPRGVAVEKITNEKNPLADASEKDLAALIGANFHEYRDNSVRWSGVFFVCIFGAAILSALAGAIIKLDFLKERSWKNDVAAIFAVFASLLGIISTTGDFQRKWQANRLAASGMENLAYELLKKPVTEEDRKKILLEIQEINLKRNREIIGDDEQTKDKKSKDSSKENNNQKTEDSKANKSSNGGNKTTNVDANSSNKSNTNANQ
jgi:hypothetical protein